MTRAEAVSLRRALSNELREREEFVRTVGRHRADGSYEVRSRRAASAGHVKVFDSFAELERLYAELPAEFTAEDVEHPGLSGGRRHLVVHHVAEHPSFACEIVKRQPLTARKCRTG